MPSLHDWFDGDLPPVRPSPPLSHLGSSPPRSTTRITHTSSRTVKRRDKRRSLDAMSTSGFTDPYAVRVTAGTLVTCDSAAKQILLHVDSQRDGPAKFILRDVDETHVLVKKEYLEEIKDLLQDELEKNTYVQDINVQ